jgi:hypothetical protein
MASVWVTGIRWQHDLSDQGGVRCQRIRRHHRSDQVGRRHSPTPSVRHWQHIDEAPHHHRRRTTVRLHTTEAAVGVEHPSARYRHRYGVTTGNIIGEALAPFQHRRRTGVSIPSTNVSKHQRPQPRLPLVRVRIKDGAAADSLMTAIGSGGELIPDRQAAARVYRWLSVRMIDLISLRRSLG